MSEAGERSTPYYCPYCAGEDLRPSAGPEHGDAAPAVAKAAPAAGDAAPAVAKAAPAARNAWECRECTRVFSVTLIGLVVSR